MLTIAERLADVRQRVHAAATRASRDATSVRLIAVSKTFPAAAVLDAYSAGQTDFGENKVQEGIGKIAETRPANLTWHLLGHLQSNKAKRAAAEFAWLHSIDSVSLLRRVDEAARDAGTTPSVLVQVDLAREATKFGAPPGELPKILEAASNLVAARVQGLMLLPPFADNPEDARSWFRQLRDLRDGLVARGTSATMLRELSMGMSHDFEVAIEEGATMVRVGTAIFGSRT